MSICYNSLFLRGSVKTTYLSEPEIIKTSRLRGHPGVHYFQVLEMVIRFFLMSGFCFLFLTCSIFPHCCLLPIPYRSGLL